MSAIASSLGFIPLSTYRLQGTRWALFFAAFTTFAVGVPFLCHQFDLAGQVFLPMHFAVLLAAMVMGVRGGILTALASPLISFGLSGMPSSAILLPMLIELTTYAAVAGWFVHHRRTMIITALFFSMIAGRMVSLGLFASGLSVAPSVVGHFRTAFLVGFPGVILQLVFLPPAVSKIGACLKKVDA